MRYLNRLILMAACTMACGIAMGQSVVLSPTASSSAPPEPTANTPTANYGPAQSQQTASTSNSAGVSGTIGATATTSAAPSAPTPSTYAAPTAGYVSGEGDEPDQRLDVGHVSPDLLKLYAQQPGESQGQYVERMNQLYRQSEAALEQQQAQNAAYLRSLIPSQSAVQPSQ